MRQVKHQFRLHERPDLGWARDRALIEPGDFVGWLFVNEPDELGMIGGRLY